MNKKGMTLVEIIVAVAIVGIIATVIGNVFIFGSKSFKNSDTQSVNQMDVRLASAAISRELRYADEIEVVGLGTDFKEGKKHIYYDTETKRLLKRDGYKPPKELLDKSQIFSNVTFDVTRVESTKDENPGFTLNFNVRSKAGAKKSYEISSAISLPNLKHSLEATDGKNADLKMITFIEKENMANTYEDGVEAKTFWNNLMEDYENKKVLLAHQANMSKSYLQKQGKDGELIEQFESIVISGDKQGEGAMVFKDVRDYVESIKDYTITIDAQTSNKGGGWGILLNGLIDKSNNTVKDDGYMLQFDPGANGIVIRQIHGGKHSSINNIGVTRTDKRIRNYNNSYFPADFVNDKFIMEDLNINDRKDRKKEDAYYSPSWTNQRYKTEIKVKIDDTKGMLLDVTLIDSKGNRSNTVKFGDFGTYTINTKPTSTTFNGSPLNFKYKDGDGNTTTTWDGKKDRFPGSYIGFRSWNGTAYGTDHETKFYGVEIENTKR